MKAPARALGGVVAGRAGRRSAIAVAAASATAVAVAAALALGLGQPRSFAAIIGGSAVDQAPPDAGRVADWLRRAADAHDDAAETELRRWAGRGDRTAQHGLIQLLQHRPGSANESQLRRLLDRAARGGDGWAATQLADRSLHEFGPLDRAAADARRLQLMQWYRQGADSGVPEAERMLGVLLQDGGAGSAGPAAARAWLERAAVHGDAAAMFLLANALRSGQGGVADEAAALRWYQRAADADYAPALQTLSLASRYGELGLPVDHAQERLLDHEAAEALAHQRPKAF